MRLKSYFFILLFVSFASSLFASENLWSELESGDKLIFIRHAYAPGGGDPDNFDLADCATQRNLNDQGISQSVELGKLFQEHQTPIDIVYSSQWCRCKDTAQYAFGDFEELSSLNSTFEGEYKKNHDTQMSELKTLVEDWNPSKGNLVFVTHYVIIGGLLGYYPSSGEIVVADQSLKVIGSFKTDY